MSDEPKTKLGKELREIRRQIVVKADSLLDWADLTTVTEAEANEMVRKARAEAVEAERERFVLILNEEITRTYASDEQRKALHSEVNVRRMLVGCRNAIRPSEPNPAPAPEPMTVAKLMVKWHHTNESPRFKADLQALVNAAVQEQSRKDADVAEKSTYEGRRWIADEIRKAAGLG